MRRAGIIAGWNQGDRDAGGLSQRRIVYLARGPMVGRIRRVNGLGGFRAFVGDGTLIIVEAAVVIAGGAEVRIFAVSVVVFFGVLVAGGVDDRKSCRGRAPRRWRFASGCPRSSADEGERCADRRVDKREGARDRAVGKAIATREGAEKRQQQNSRDPAPSRPRGGDPGRRAPLDFADRRHHRSTHKWILHVLSMRLSRRIFQKFVRALAK